MSSEATTRAVREIHRPVPALLVYYALTSLVLGPLFPLLLVPRFFRYRTLRYGFGEEGISMRWGILFRREIHLTYPRVQDIHLRSNVVERWLGLGRVLIQTASGSAKPEMIVEGVPEFEAVRDFVYERMRGARDESEAAAAAPVAPAASGVAEAEAGDLAAALGAVADELREIRKLLAARGERGS